MNKLQYVKLKNCCDVIGGSTPKRDVPEYWMNEIPWVTPKDISSLESPFLDDAPEYISTKGYNSCSTYLLPKNSILLTTRAPIGNVAIAGREMCTNQGFKSLVPHNGVDFLYLYYCIKHHSPKLQALGNGATFKEISKKVVEDFQIPLPSLIEQKRIASILDKADSARRKRQKAIELSEQLLHSVFLDMFGDPISNPKGYKLGKIGDLLSSVNYGTSSKAGENGQFPILRMNNITYAGNWDLGNLKYIDMDEKERKKYTAEPGDILFNRTNSKELVGKTAVFREKEPYIFAGYLIRSKTNSLAEPEYISGFLNSAYGKKVLRNMCKSIVGMANINAKEYQSIEILIPPIEEQQKYAKITKKIRLNISCYQYSLNKCDELFNSLSQKAFRGELSKLSETEFA
ncbi:MAG: hypothetical protein BGO90_09295 [Legionella sp. 40-6]|nr:MAG: hypothetical protein BGO90_09295 [Legionella sp. 40-6]